MDKAALVWLAEYSMELEKLAHTLREASHRIGIPHTSLQDVRFRERIGLRVTKIGRRVLVLESDLQELLRRGRERPGDVN
jgi:hypothetical protein